MRIFCVLHYPTSLPPWQFLTLVKEEENIFPKEHSTIKRREHTPPDLPYIYFRSDTALKRYVYNLASPPLGRVPKYVRLLSRQYHSTGCLLFGSSTQPSWAGLAALYQRRPAT